MVVTTTDGGQTWTKMGQVDANNGVYYHDPAIAGNSDGSSVTVAWTRPNDRVFARTWTSSGGWGSIRTLWTPSTSGTWRVGPPDVLYDNDGDILVVWRAYDYDNSTTEGIFYSFSTNDGVSWSSYAGVPDASCNDCTHYHPQLTLDTSRNDVWMAYAHNINNRDIRLKRWSGSSNSWQSGNPVVASTSDREIHPGIGYVADTDALWVTWHRYSGYSNPNARLYYVRSTAGSLPNPTWGTTRGPYGVRTAETHPAMVVGDSSDAYIAYLAYNDSYRGGNIYLLTVPASGGVPSQTDQVCATVDDPPLYARGNGGNPQLLWLETTVNGQTNTGPTLLYSKNPPDNEDPDYGTNLGVAQTLFNQGENFDLYISQAGVRGPTAVNLAGFDAAVQGRDVLVTWNTASEIDLAGFNLYRSRHADGPYTRLNEGLIPAENPGSVLGASYEWLDRGVEQGRAYYYELEQVEAGGGTLESGLVRVVVPYRVFLPLILAP